MSGREKFLLTMLVTVFASQVGLLGYGVYKCAQDQRDIPEHLWNNRGDYARAPNWYSIKQAGVNSVGF